jgi:YnbE-like lipoprotein
MKDRRSKFGALLGATVALGTLGGCVEVTAPDKPIEINLNINIRQEVVVRLAEDVRDLRRREPGVF